MNKALTGAAAVLAVTVTLTAFIKYEDWITLPRARAPVIAMMKDPSSTQFRNDRITRNGWLCGEVNAKNSMGGYTGFKKYMSGGLEASYIEGDGALGEWSTTDVIALLDEKTAILKQYNKWRAEGVDVPRFSDSEMEEKARRRFFESKWKDICEI